MGTQYVLSVGWSVLDCDWMVGGEKAVAASKAVRRGRSCIFGGGEGGLGFGMGVCIEDDGID